MSAIPIKLKFQNEIRRIQVAEDKISFASLSRTSQKLFPRLPTHQRISFVWFDDEGDKIVASSESEIREAIRVMHTEQRKNYRFQVFLNPIPSGQESDAPTLRITSKDVEENTIPNKDDAKKYLGEVKEYLKGRPNLYRCFLENLNRSRVKSLSVPIVIEKINSLLGENRDLLIGFTQFLPTNDYVVQEKQDRDGYMLVHSVDVAIAATTSALNSVKPCKESAVERSELARSSCEKSKLIKETECFQYRPAVDSCQYSAPLSSSSTLSASIATIMTTVDRGNKTLPTPSRIGPSVAVVDSVTFPAGTAVQPASVLHKTWRVRNTGPNAWPLDTVLSKVYSDESSSLFSQNHSDSVSIWHCCYCAKQFSGVDALAQHVGSKHGLVLGGGETVVSTPVPALPAGAEANISVTLQAPEALGRFVSTYRLCSNSAYLQQPAHTQGQLQTQSLIIPATVDGSAGSSGMGAASVSSTVSPLYFNGDSLLVDVVVADDDGGWEMVSGLLSAPFDECAGANHVDQRIPPHMFACDSDSESEDDDVDNYAGDEKGNKVAGLVTSSETSAAAVGIDNEHDGGAQLVGFNDMLDEDDFAVVSDRMLRELDDITASFSFCSTAIPGTAEMDSDSLLPDFRTPDIGTADSVKGEEELDEFAEFAYDHDHEQGQQGQEDEQAQVSLNSQCGSMAGVDYPELSYCEAASVSGSEASALHVLQSMGGVSDIRGAHSSGQAAPSLLATVNLIEEEADYAALLRLWSAEICGLVGMGFTDVPCIIEMLRMHVVIPGAPLDSAGMQRVIDALLLV